MILPNNSDLATRKTYVGGTILHGAAWENNHDVSRFIIQQGGGRVINTKDDYNDTPLTKAIRFEGDVRMIKLLIGAGADPELQGKDGKSPLEWAQAKGKNDIVNFLKSL